MDNDINYYQSSYHHQGGPPSAMKHSPSAGPYGRQSRPPIGGGGLGPSGPPMSQPPSSVYSNSKHMDVGYGPPGRAPTGVPPPRKPMMEPVGGPGLPPMVRDYQYDSIKDPYHGYDGKKMHSQPMMATSPPSGPHPSSLGGYSNRSSYQHDDLHPKYDMLSSGNAGVRSGSGYGRDGVDAREEGPVSKMSSSYSSGSGPGMQSHSTRDSMALSSYDRAPVVPRELEPSALMRNSDHRPVNAGVPPSTLEKYFSSDEIKRFNEYNRHLVMSSPGRQKKFYATLASAEYKRFIDFVDFEQSNSNKINAKALPPPPPILGAAKMAVPPPPPIPMGSYEPAYASSYSYSSSFYDEDKPSPGPPGGGRSGGEHHRGPPLGYQSKSKYSDDPSSHHFMKSGLSYEYADNYERSSRDHDVPLARYSDYDMPPIRGSGAMLERGLDYGKPPSYHRRSGRSRSRSRSGSPHSRSRSPRSYHSGRQLSPGPKPTGYYHSHRDYHDEREPRERERNDSYSSSNRRSHSPSSYQLKPRPTSSSRDANDYKLTPTTNSMLRKLSPKAEHKYLKNSLDKVKKIHKLKLEELDEIKRRDNDSDDSYIYKKISNSVKDVEKTILTIERQIAANKKKMPDDVVLTDDDEEEEEVEVKKNDTKKDEKPKEEVKSSSSSTTQAKKATSTKTVSPKKTVTKAASTSAKATKAEPKPAAISKSNSTASNSSASTKTTNELSKDASSSSIVSAASTISATHENVSKLPKIPKLSSKKPAAVASPVVEKKKPVTVKKTATATKTTTQAKTATTSKSTTEKTSTTSKSSAKSTVPSTTESTKSEAKPTRTDSSSKLEAKPKTESSSTTKSESKSKSENSSSSASKSTKTEDRTTSSSSKHATTTSSSSSSAIYSYSRFGPITEEEIEQILPNYQWCSLCKNFFETTDEFVSHLHRDAHLNGLRTSDFAIIKRAEEKLDNAFIKELEKEQQQVPHKRSGSICSTLNGTNVANQSLDQSNANDQNSANSFLGTEFLYPSKSYYCDLCAKFLYSTQQTEIHLHSDKHQTLYKRYLQKNKDYESKMISQRKSTFKFSYLMRTLIRMKDKGEDIVARVSQERVRRDRQREKDRERDREDSSTSAAGPSKRRKLESQSSVNEIESLLTDLLEQVQSDCETVEKIVSDSATVKSEPSEEQPQQVAVVVEQPVKSVSAKSSKVAPKAYAKTVAKANGVEDSIPPVAVKATNKVKPEEEEPMEVDVIKNGNSNVIQGEDDEDSSAETIIDEEEEYEEVDEENENGDNEEEGGGGGGDAGDASVEDEEEMEVLDSNETKGLKKQGSVEEKSRSSSIAEVEDNQDEDEDTEEEVVDEVGGEHEEDGFDVIDEA